MKKVTLLNKIIIVIASLGGIYYCIDALRAHNIYQALICLTIIPVILLPFLLEKFGKLQIPDSLISFYMIFIFFGYFLGSILKFYGKFDYFDKVVHFCSGILAGLLAIYIYKMRMKDQKLNPFIFILFIISFVSLSAVTWEIFEFVSDQISGKDAQHVLDTGVDDTMIDMIVALAGSILLSVKYALERKNKKGMVHSYMKEVEECYEK